MFTTTTKIVNQFLDGKTVFIHDVRSFKLSEVIN